MNKIKIIFLVGTITSILCVENTKNIKGTAVDNNVEVITLTKDNLKEYLKKSNDTLLIIKFYAPWCGPCNRMEKGFQELSEEFSDMVFTKVNIDTEDALSEQYDISSVPTIVFIKNGKEVKRTIGYKSKPTLRKIIKNVQSKIIQF